MGAKITKRLNSMNKKSTEIQQALEALHIKGLVSKTSHQTGGRATEVWFTKETNLTKKGVVL